MVCFVEPGDNRAGDGNDCDDCPESPTGLGKVGKTDEPRTGSGDDHREQRQPARPGKRCPGQCEQTEPGEQEKIEVADKRHRHHRRKYRRRDRRSGPVPFATAAIQGQTATRPHRRFHPSEAQPEIRAIARPQGLRPRAPEITALTVEKAAKGFRPSGRRDRSGVDHVGRDWPIGMATCDHGQLGPRCLVAVHATQDR